jgi:hypothetical protein
MLVLVGVALRALVASGPVGFVGLELRAKGDATDEVSPRRRLENP